MVDFTDVLVDMPKMTFLILEIAKHKIQSLTSKTNVIDIFDFSEVRRHYVPYLHPIACQNNSSRFSDYELIAKKLNFELDFENEERCKFGRKLVRDLKRTFLGI